MHNDSEDTFHFAIDFRRLLSTLQRWAWLLLLAAALGAVLAYLYSRQQTPVYEAETNILVTLNSQPSIGDLSQSLNLTQLVETYVRMLSLDEFAGIVSQRLGYKVDVKNVNVSSLPNTQVIQVKVLDVDPTRAAKIADTMVVVLREQNETLQAGRYAVAEQNLDKQIKDAEAQTADIQAKLDAAKTSALVQQTAEAQSNIDTTVNAIKDTTAQLDRLHKMTWVDAHFMLSDAKNRLPKLQAVLDQQTAAQNDLQVRLSSDPQAQTDANYAGLIQGQIADLDAKIEKTRQSIEDTQKEIAFLTPLDTQQGFAAALVEKDNLLKTQESLLTSYQNVYTSLLSTEEVRRTTNEIDNLKQNLALYQNVYLNLLSNREDIKKQEMQNIPSIEQVSPSRASDKPVKPRTLLNTLLAGAGGLILALAFVMMREMTDDTLKSRDEVEELLGTKVIGYITNIKDNYDGEGIYVGRSPRSPVAEAFRSLRTNLEFAAREKALKTIIVTSGGPEEGKTTVASNLAAVLSHSGKKVILVDADLRRPRIHRYTGISNAKGLSDVIGAEQETDFNEYVQKLENTPALSILPSGDIPSNPTDLLGSEKMKDFLSTLSDSYDYVVIDCPPMLVADPQVLLGLADGVLLVLVPGKTRKEVVRAIKEQVEQTGVRLLGVVFNRLQPGHHAGYGGYSYYDYPYYYSSDYYTSKDKDGEAAGKKVGHLKRGAKKDLKSPDALRKEGLLSPKLGKERAPIAEASRRRP
jgi:capsular exopolysaccharide synthesis family protein